MAQKPAGPHPSTALAAALRTLGDEFERSGDQIDRERVEGATALVRAARQLVGQAGAPVDRDALALLRVTAACVSTPGAEAPDTADVAAALALIAKTVADRAATGWGRPAADAGLAHVRGTLDQLAACGAGEGPLRDSSRSADMTPIDDA
jgi:hypothetical protein